MIDLERLDLAIKSAFGVLAGIASLSVGYFGIVFSVLLAFMILDFISGILVAIYEKKLNSKIGTKGLVKKLYYILLILATYLVELALLESGGAIADGLSGAFIVMEFVSITENSGKLNLPLPRKLKDLIASLNNRGESK